MGTDGFHILNLSAVEQQAELKGVAFEKEFVEKNKFSLNLYSQIHALLYFDYWKCTAALRDISRKWLREVAFSENDS